jgi:hypothetical protein
MKTAELLDRTVSNIRPLGAGWQWDVSGIDMHNRNVTITCRTNQGREGIWECYESGEEHQIMGKAQFSLPSSKPAAAKKIRQFHTPAEEPVYA